MTNFFKNHNVDVVENEDEINKEMEKLMNTYETCEDSYTFNLTEVKSKKNHRNSRQGKALTI